MPSLRRPHPQPSPSAPKATPWYRLGLTVVASGFALQLGTLPAAANTAGSEVQLLHASGIIEAIAHYGNVDSNDNVPRRGDPRVRHR
ncbi:MAG: hypothetical protein AAGF75_12985 [Cyanobacteria bacterium P01_H01_bin.130]